MNYKKSLLSVAAATAIVAASLSADYLPLTSTTVDNHWVAFGITDFKSDGSAEGVAGEFTFANTYSISDPLDDDIEVSGITTSGDLVQINSNEDELEVRIEPYLVIDGVTPIPYDNTDPVRTIYVKTASAGSIDFAISYKSVLEGYPIQFKIGDADQTAYQVTLDYTKTYTTPALAEEIEGTDPVTGTSLNSISDGNASNLIDYDLEDNPPKSSSWTNADHGDAKAVNGSITRMYTYDAEAYMWLIHDNRNADSANDFNTMTLGKGYWGRVDVDGSGNDNVNGEEEAGLVLGDSSNLDTSDYASVGLAEGWNFIALNGGDESNIRDISVGMIMTLENVGAVGEITITDSSGNHSLVITTIEDDDVVATSKIINAAVVSAKALGSMPHNFHLKAFPTGVANEVLLLGNKRFTIADTTADDMVSFVRSLTGTNTTPTGLTNPSSKQPLGATAMADLNATGVMSTYGEYAVIIEPKFATQAQGIAMVGLNGDGVGSVPALDLSGAAAALAASALYNGNGDLKAGVVDLDMDGTDAYIIMASLSPFSIRDNTFVRAFEYQNPAVLDSVIKVYGSGLGGTATVTAGDNLAAGLSDVDGIAGVEAIDDGTKILVITKEDANFYVGETTGDNFQVTTSSSDVMKGAVAKVYSTDFIAKLEGHNIVIIDIVEETSHAAEEVTFNYDTVYVATDTGTAIVTGEACAVVGVCTNAEEFAFFEALVEGIEADFVAKGITATVSHNYNIAGGAPNGADIANAKVTIIGSDVIDAQAVYTNPIGAPAEATPVAGAEDIGYIDDEYADSGDLTTDLKYNNIYSPDYAMTGPMYIMNDNNMTLRGIVSGTTDLSDGSIAWESLDLTRNPSEWYSTQLYDLFETEANAAYWVNLESTTPAALTLDSNSTTYTYMHHFDTTGGDDTINSLAADISVTIGGLNAADAYASSRATATVDGETIELTRTASTTTFTGSLNSHEANIRSNNAFNIIINAADGFGNSETFEITDFDFTQPLKPVVTEINGTIHIDANETDTDVNGFYVYNGAPIEGSVAEQEASALKITRLDEPGTLSVACTNLTASVFGSDPAGLRIVAVDGTGYFGGGNVSDAESVSFMPILKERVMITATNDGGDWSSTTGGNFYDTACADQGALADNNITGVSLSSLTDDATVQVAYEKLDSNVSIAIPVTVYVVNDLTLPAGDQVHAAFTYPAGYENVSVFFELGEVVFGYELESQAELDARGNSSALPVDLTNDGAVSNNPKTGIKL